MNTIKKLTIIVLILLLIGIITTLLMGGFMPIFSIAFGLLFLYYALIYFVIRFLKNNQRYKFIFYILFILPIFWGIIDWGGLVDFLLEGIHLDMK
ncbi:hypothetical protein J4E06_04580 [Muricauda sp. NFXS6]|uniref:hypothetical protein n=1 Tax=Flavobacteriaceae TaxID=49546 RepID=UPI0032DE2CFA|tara:strand:- start:9506 stop:9790 length:285 start_codon:yes stop_codon:yes gene_type:complete